MTTSSDNNPAALPEENALPAGDALPEGLEGLQLTAPPDTFKRFHQRASILLGARFVLERQFLGFWIVLNTMLKLLFKHIRVPVTSPPAAQARRYRELLNKSKEGRS